jgi:hypothetical protein
MNVYPGVYSKSRLFPGVMMTLQEGGVLTVGMTWRFAPMGIAIGT